ncbi:MAG: hypothetical protein FD153_1364 [Rhodospirillaceae bacterium]|nr:MAG: hypothetical protein FD153_1364 [Rhodospirillaceae bacterium]
MCPLWWTLSARGPNGVTVASPLPGPHTRRHDHPHPNPPPSQGGRGLSVRGEEPPGGEVEMTGIYLYPIATAFPRTMKVAILPLRYQGMAD